MNAFLSLDNKNVLFNVLNENTSIPIHIKNGEFFEKELTRFYNEQPIGEQTLLETNKTFLSYYINKNKTMTNSHIQDIRLSEFDSKLKQKQYDFENFILKKPEPIQFNENITMTELDMEKELQLKIKERNNDILPIIMSVPTNEFTSIQSENKLKNASNLLLLNETRKYDNQKDKKRVSFSTEEETFDVSAIFLELTQIKQEILDLKKMVGLMTTFLSHANQTE